MLVELPLLVDSAALERHRNPESFNSPHGGLSHRMVRARWSAKKAGCLVLLLTILV